MRLINKESITRVVDEYYPSSKYKIFTINSEDGITMRKPVGLFVSLGITTSLSTMKMLCDAINKSLDAKSTISEIESRIISGVYTNKVSKVNVTEQYDSGTINKNESILSKDDISSLLEELKSKLVDNKDNEDKFLDYSCRVSKVSKILKKMDSSDLKWEDYSISVINTDNEFKLSIINSKINYIQSTELYNGKEIIVHKRIGILVEF